MARLIYYNILFVPRSGAKGTLIQYKKQGQIGWTTPQSPANPTMLSPYLLQLEENTTYYIAISSVGDNCVQQNEIHQVVTPKLTPCCPAGFTLVPDESFCYREETQAPEVETSGICLAPSPRSPEYSLLGAKLYDPGYSVRLHGTFTLMTTPYWQGTPAGNISNSPMNKDAVWIDSNCDGTKDPLRNGAILQFTYLLDTPVAKTVYIGIGGDNTFRVDINNNSIVNCDGTFPAGGGGETDNFTYWHLFPVQLRAGPNYINFQSVGDGSINDAFAAVIYDNSAVQLQNADSDERLNMLFRTRTFIGTTVDIATCPPDFTLDTSGGAGNYICRKFIETPTISCSVS